MLWSNNCKNPSQTRYIRYKEGFIDCSHFGPFCKSLDMNRTNLEYLSAPLAMFSIMASFGKFSKLSRMVLSAVENFLTSSSAKQSGGIRNTMFWWWPSTAVMICCSRILLKKMRSSLLFLRWKIEKDFPLTSKQLWAEQVAHFTS